jgi:glycerol-3-phosphate acyltransferase PlsY
MIQAAILAYLLGSIPFGLLLTRMAGLGDIRAIGSGNIGATNVLRTGRRGLAAATLVLDAAKGAAAVLLAGRLFGAAAMPVAAVFAVIGHCAPVWLRFRGGKGVATGLGAMAGLAWPVCIVACLVWLAGMALTRMSSASALAAFVVAPIVALRFAAAPASLALLLIALLVIARHHANIRRLLAGTEPRVGARR